MKLLFKEKSYKPEHIKLYHKKKNLQKKMKAKVINMMALYLCHVILGNMFALHFRPIQSEIALKYK